MEIKNFIENYRQSYSKFDTRFNCNQLQFLKYNNIREIKLYTEKEFFHIFFEYDNKLCKLEFTELKDNVLYFIFKDKGNTLNHKIEVKKESKFDIIQKAIESAVLTICFDNFTL